MTTYITELLVDGQWQNITPDVRDKAPIVLERGRRDWATETDPSTCSLRLNNGISRVAAGVQGRYSPLNPRSDLFGKIGRNTPIRVREDGPRDAFGVLPGFNDSYVSTPDVAALDVTGDIDIRIDIHPTTWRPEGDFGLARKYVLTADQRSWALILDETGIVQFLWSPDGTLASRITANSTVAVPSDSGRLALRVTLDVNNGAAGNDVAFYTSDSIDGTWTQLGATVTTGGVTSVHSGTADVELGQVNRSGTGIISNPFQGTVYAFAILSGIAGTAVADPRFTEHEPETRTFVDDAGRTWTLHDSATIADTSIRFVGEAKSWPPESDLSGADRWVKLTAAGITRRLQRGKKPLNSSLFRDLSIRDDVVVYYPLEEVKGATRFTSGRADDTSFLEPILEVTLAGDDETFFASAALPTVRAGRITGNLPSYTGAADQRLVFLVSIPADVTWGSEQTLLRAYTTGTAKRWDISKTSADGTRIRAFDGDGTELLNSATSGLNLFGDPAAFSLWLQQDGADIDWQMAIFPLDGTQALAFGGTLAGQTFSRFRRVSLGVPGVDFEDTTFGHVFILNDDVQSIWDTILNSMVGWSGETGLSRLVRLAADAGLPAVRSIGADDAETMGPQLVKTQMELFREVPAADLGILTDRPDAIGLQYRSRIDLYSQDPVLVLDYSSGVIDDPFRPVEDDQNIVNEVTVQRPRGASFTAADTTGPLSSLDPPDGVGRYDISQDVNIDTDERLENQAFWRLHLGTINEPRFPEVSLNLRNPRAAALEAAVLSVTEGDIIRITNPPVWLPGGPYDLLVEGIREEKSAVTHVITFACSPGSAWNAFLLDDAELGRLDTGGSTLAAGAALLLTGVSPGRASTPDSATLDITGDLDVRVHLAMDDWTPAASTAPVSKWLTVGVDERSWTTRINTTGTLALFWTEAGTAPALSATSTAVPTVADGEPLWLRYTIDVDNGAAGRDIRFYTSPDGETWTQLGTTVTQAGATSIFAGTAELAVGAYNNGGSERLAGRVFSAEIRNGIDGTIVANPDFGALAAGTTAFFNHGLPWTVHAPATINDGKILVATDAGSQVWMRQDIGLVLPTEVGSYATTPDNAALDITGDIEIRAEVRRDSWSEIAAVETLLAKWVVTGNQRSYWFLLLADGTLRFQWSSDGANTLTETSSVPVPLLTGGRVAVRVTRDSATGDVTFSFSDSIDGTYTQLGAVQSSTPSAIFASTSAVFLGVRLATTTDLWDGSIYAARVYDGIAGTVVANPDFTAQAIGTTSFTDSAGRVWTVAGDARVQPADPFDILVAGEVMRVHSITGTTSPQEFTVQRAVNGVAKAQASGDAVALAKPFVLSL